ncbi:MAG: hypothetical protein H6965_07940 [Chromatiaceae bacterium]|nr:hypothetical protein [Chromatiaceae bacterium]
MQYTFGGLILATFFGVFFGSEGELDPVLVSSIFWGLIGGGVFLNLLVILRDQLCSKGILRVVARRASIQRYLHC